MLLKIDDETKGQITNTNTSISHSFNSSSNSQKYGGLIQRSFGKRLHKNISLTFKYIYSVVPPYTNVHFVMTIVRLIQMAGPSFCAGYKSFWNTNHQVYQTLSIFSIFFHLIPPDYRSEGGFIFHIIYLVILISFICLLLFSSFYYQKYANLPKHVPQIIALYLATFGFVLHPIAFEFGFSGISRLIFASEESKDVVLRAVIDVLVFVFSVAYFYLYLNIASQTILFQPISIMTATTAPQNLIFNFQITITSILALGEYAEEKTTKAIFPFVGFLLYFCAMAVEFYQGGIVDIYVTMAYIAMCEASAFMCLGVGIMILLDVKASFIPFAIYVILFVALFVGTNYVVNRVKISRLSLLDRIYDNPASFDEVKSVNQFVNISVYGYANAHPVCLNWKFLKYGVDKWPKNQTVWYIYSKFVAIYPEETQVLAWIFHMIVTNKVKGVSAKTVKEQTVTIARQRENNLGPDLKVKLNQVLKHLTSAKHKLRHVWDLAIQCNIADMESATSRAIKEIDRSDAELLHILRMFPNNRFVTRQYARFCKEMKGDHAKYVEMVEKTRMLQRGLNVNKDQAHEYGIMTFNNLPDCLSRGRDANNMVGVTVDSNTSSQFEFEPEDDNNSESDESISLLKRIQTLLIPSTRGSMVMRAGVYVLLFVVPIIAILVYSRYFISDISEPLRYITTFSYCRTFCVQAATFIEQIILERFNLLPQPEDVYGATLGYLGGSWKTIDQLTATSVMLTNNIQGIEQFRSYRSQSIAIKSAKAIVFDNTVEYIYYKNGIGKKENISLQSAISDLLVQIAYFVNQEQTIPEDVIDLTCSLNTIMNVNIISSSFTQILSHISESVEENGKNVEKIVMIVIYISIALVIILEILVIIVEFFWLRSTKRRVYQCLTSLPKNIVSMLTENLRILKKESEQGESTSITNNTEVNKQEDNILKIFVAGGTTKTTKIADVGLLIIGVALLIGLHIGCTCVLGFSFQSVSKTIREKSPHIYVLMGAYSFQVAAFSAIKMMIGFNDPKTKLQGLSKEYLTLLYHQRSLTAKNSFNFGRFGGNSANFSPFGGYDTTVENANSKFICENQFLVPDNFLNATKCFSVDSIYLLIGSFLDSYTKEYESDPALEAMAVDPILNTLWSLSLYPVYDVFFAPIIEDIVTMIKSSLSSTQQKAITVTVVLFVISLFGEFLADTWILSIETHVRSVLKLLLLCPTKTILTTPKIMTILSGDFSTRRGDLAARGADFFKMVVSNLPDGIIITDELQNIVRINKAFVRIFGIEEEKVINLPIRDFLSAEKFTAGDIDSLILSPQQQNSKVTFSTQLRYIRKDNTEVNLEADSALLSNLLIFIFRDTTQTVRYNSLIFEEKSRSDHLLSSILPPSLVARVQSGEKNISFAVQSATILFMDIVSFTPWCGSLPADKVMSTLNNLFKRLDAIVVKYPTITKIKCIGDCYMAAGGVFSEINMPSEHSKEVVCLGLDSLDAINDLNLELNEKLQIRVGVNTGGPIIAGVLGIGKPTFEILGPAINMAQQMEHHGVPMQVHVSRSVYELIYGDNFNIKERGTVEVKGGNVITYLVTRK